MILKIAEKIGLPVLISKQAHGAKLSREKKLLARAQEINPDVDRLIIVEIPGPEIEKELSELGLEVVIIDHHRYDDLDRMQKQSSLEQFLKLLKINDKKLTDLGFNPMMVRSVAALDRGFIWELKKQGLSQKDFRRALNFYRALTLELGGERREREETTARAAWQTRTEKSGIIIVKSSQDKISIRDPISFIVAEQFDAPRPVIIIQGERRMYVQDCDFALDLYKRFGGFTFGQDRCWGILKDNEPLPDLDEVVSIIIK